MHRICTNCGCHGHFLRECKHAIKSNKVEGLGVHNPGSAGGDGAFPPLVPPIENPSSSATNAVNEAVVKEKNLADSVARDIGYVLEDQEPLYGDWMIVKKKPCKNWNQENGKDFANCETEGVRECQEFSKCY